MKQFWRHGMSETTLFTRGTHLMIQINLGWHGIPLPFPPCPWCSWIHRCVHLWELNVTLLLLLILLFLLFFLLFLLFHFLLVQVIPVIFLRNLDVHGCRMNQIWNLMTLNIQDSRLSYILNIWCWLKHELKHWTNYRHVIENLFLVIF